MRLINRANYLLTLISQSPQRLLAPLLIEVHYREHRHCVLVSLVLLQRLDKAIELVLLAALWERPLARIGERPDGRQARLHYLLPVEPNALLSVANSHLFDALLNATFAWYWVRRIAGTREILIFDLGMTVFVNADYFEGDIAIGGDRLIVVVPHIGALLGD